MRLSESLGDFADESGNAFPIIVAKVIGDVESGPSTTRPTRAVVGSTTSGDPLATSGATDSHRFR